MRYWTPAELRTFLGTIDGHQHYPLIRLAAMSGMRRGELCGLRWVDVDLDGRTVSVRRSITAVQGKVVGGDVKTKRSRRVIDIDPATIAVLRRWHMMQLEVSAVDGCWLAQRPGLCSRCRLVRAGTRHDHAGVRPARHAAHEGPNGELDTRPPRITFHDLRHSHATHLLAAGVNVKVVSERLGHASVAFTLDVYSHVMPGQQADAAAAVAALVDVVGS